MARGDRRTLLTEMRLEQAQANRVRQVLGDSAKAIEERLTKVGTSGNPLTRMQLEAQRASIKAVLAQDFKSIGESIRTGKIDAAKAASGVVSQYENTLLKAVMDESAMRRIARAEAQRTVNNLEAALKRIQGTSYNPLSKQVYKTKKLADGWIDNIVDKALVSGWSASQLADAVIPSISPNVRGGVSYAANRLARTEINNAYHAASWDRYNRSAIVEEVEWLLSSSHPEDDICNDYAAQSPFKKNAVPAKPHPNCYCYIVPRLPTEEEFLDRLFAGEYGDEPWASEVDSGDGVFFSQDAISAGMAKAESIRKAMERAIYDRKGNFNKARGWGYETYKARSSYIEMGHKDMNLLLRNPAKMAADNAGDPYWVELADQQNKALVRLIDKNPLSSDVTVARGVIVNDDFNPGVLKVGESFADPGFLSTTTNMDEALNFAAGRGRVDNAEGWTFITNAPSGTKAIAGADYQNELVFGPGQMQKVLGIDRDKRIIYTEMTS